HLPVGTIPARIITRQVADAAPTIRLPRGGSSPKSTRPRTSRHDACTTTPSRGDADELPPRATHFPVPVPADGSAPLGQSPPKCPYSPPPTWGGGSRRRERRRTCDA